MDTISAWIAERDPGAATVPVVLPGFTDSRHFRAGVPGLRRLRVLPAPPPVAAGERAARARRRRAHRRARPRVRDRDVRRPRAPRPRLSAVPAPSEAPQGQANLPKTPQSALSTGASESRIIELGCQGRYVERWRASSEQGSNEHRWRSAARADDRDAHVGVIERTRQRRRHRDRARRQPRRRRTHGGRARGAGQGPRRRAHDDHHRGTAGPQLPGDRNPELRRRTGSPSSRSSSSSL